MRAHATRVDTGMDLIEIVGTGGDNAHSFNISTTAALVTAAGGGKVAKHGNRAASSQCGTADCLEALGVNIHQSPALCRQLLEEVGLCFFFAQKYHTSMKYVGPIRKELGFRTVFNILGPLTNPGTPTVQLLGVYDELPGGAPGPGAHQPGGEAGDGGLRPGQAGRDLSERPHPGL